MGWMKVVRKNGKIYIILPEGTAGVDIKEISDNVYALVLRRGNTSKQKKEPDAKQANESREVKENSEEERVLKKLYTIPFRRREVANLKEEFLKEEIELLKKLMNAKKVFIYNKDGKRYLALASEIYHRLKQESENVGSGHTNLIDYAILSPEDAREVVKKAPQIYAAHRHFDGKVYLAKKHLFLEWKKRVMTALSKGPMHVEDLSAQTGIDERAVIITLRLLNEMGEVVEIKKDTFGLADY